MTYKYCRDNAAIALAGSSQDWTGEDQIYAAGNTDATTGGGALTDAQFTNYLVAKDFAFDLPNDAVITGIQVRIEKEGIHIKDKHIYLTKDGATVTGEDKAATTTAWPNTDTQVVHGGTTDEWGLRLTGADVNKTCFGVALAVVDDTTTDSPCVDGIEMQLTYTDPSDTVTTSSDIRKERDIYKIFNDFMADKQTTKQFAILLRNGIYEITQWGF